MILLPSNDGFKAWSRSVRLLIRKLYNDTILYIVYDIMNYNGLYYIQVTFRQHQRLLFDQSPRHSPCLPVCLTFQIMLTIILQLQGKITFLVCK